MKKILQREKKSLISIVVMLSMLLLWWGPVYANTAPVASPSAFTVAEGGIHNGLVSGMDADGDSLTFTLVSGPSYGMLIFNADGSYAYTAHRQPTVGFQGIDSFSFRAYDGVAFSEPASVEITIIPINDAPVAISKEITVRQGETYTGTVEAMDVDGDALTFVLVSAPTQGAGGVFNANGSFEYIAAADYIGEDIFSFFAHDGLADSNVALVTITVEVSDYEYVVEEGEAIIRGYNGVLSDVVIPDTLGGFPVTVIDEFAFHMNTPRITSVSIPNTVREIRWNAFGNNSLTTLVLPDSVETIGSDAFTNNDLTHITLGNGVRTIGNYAFKGNDIETITWGNSLETIGVQAFYGNNLGSLVIPDSVITIAEEAFWFSSITSLALGNSLETIGQSAFEENTIGSLTLPNSVRTVGNYAFYNSGLNTLDLGEGVQHIGDYAFADNDLTSVTIPSSVVEINNAAFYTNNISSLIILDGIETIGEYAFSNNLLMSLTLPDSIKDLGRGAFGGNALQTVVLGAGLETIGWEAFRNNNLSTVTIPSGVTSIGQNAFRNNEISWVSIPASVTTIGVGSFEENQVESEDLSIRGRYGSEAETYATNNTHTFLAYFYVTFEDWDGSLLSEQDVDEGGDAIAPVNPTREGYRFTGWDADFTNVGVDMTAIALYEVSPVVIPRYTVTFNSLGGSVVLGYQAQAGSLLIMPDPPTLEKHLFDGWYKEEALLNEWDFFVDMMPSNNLELFAKWDEVPTVPEPVEPPKEDDEEQNPKELPGTGGTHGVLVIGFLTLVGGDILRKRRQ